MLFCTLKWHLNIPKVKVWRFTGAALGLLFYGTGSLHCSVQEKKRKTNWCDWIFYFILFFFDKKKLFGFIMHLNLLSLPRGTSACKRETNNLQLAFCEMNNKRTSCINLSTWEEAAASDAFTASYQSGRSWGSWNAEHCESALARVLTCNSCWWFQEGARAPGSPMLRADRA